MGLPESNLRVHAVGPHVDEVAIGQVTGLESSVVIAPLPGQPGDRGRRQPGGGAEELLQRGDEVPGRQPVQIEQRKHLGDLRRLAAPRSQNLRGEPLALARLVDAAVVDPRGLHLDRAGRGDHGPGLVPTVADNQSVSALIPFSGQLRYVMVDFRLQCGSQHPPGALADDLVDQGAGLGRTIGIHYAEQGRTFPDLRCNAGLLGDFSINHLEGTPFACPQKLIHKS